MEGVDQFVQRVGSKLRTGDRNARSVSFSTQETFRVGGTCFNHLMHNAGAPYVGGEVLGRFEFYSLGSEGVSPIDVSILGLDKNGNVRGFVPENKRKGK